MVRRVAFQKLLVVRQFCEFIYFNVMQSVGKSHFAKPVMVAIALPVRGDMDQLRPRSSVGKAAHQTVSKTLAIAEQAFKGDSLRNWSIIEKHTDSSLRWKLHQIRPAWV